MFGAFYPNYFVRHNSSVSQSDNDKVLNGHDPMTTVYLTNFPQQQAVYGDLYVRDVRAMFRACADPENIFVEFDGSRVIVQFTKPQIAPRGEGDGREGDEGVDVSQLGRSDFKELEAGSNLTGEIIHQVFVAMKMRSLPQDRMTLHLYPEQEAARLHSELMERREEAARKRKGGGGRRNLPPPPGAEGGGGELLSFADVSRVDPPRLDTEARFQHRLCHRSNF